MKKEVVLTVINALLMEIGVATLLKYYVISDYERVTYVTVFLGIVVGSIIAIIKKIGSVAFWLILVLILFSICFYYDQQFSPDVDYISPSKAYVLLFLILILTLGVGYLLTFFELYCLERLSDKKERVGE